FAAPSTQNPGWLPRQHLGWRWSRRMASTIRALRPRDRCPVRRRCPWQVVPRRFRYRGTIAFLGAQTVAVQGAQWISLQHRGRRGHSPLRWRIEQKRTKMKVLVLGSGVIGVTTAYYLAKAGHEVEVLERRDAPAEETSFANAGQVSPGYASPWAGPGVPLK